MKILFAVSNENVSRKIVESYQKKYGEKVSFKNVFYFNAIIREIHKDKTYDRIVISEDLEPFSSSNFELIDRFILERLKQISTELNGQERYIDTVLICTDRRTKSSYVLSKFYEYGIYNALVGQDRRIDNVCTLINTPRNAQEAQEYYKIGTKNDTSSVDDVSEQEVQNILIHYKRLGKNEDRYTDSFNNIASQYTDKQLKIIIKCLPLNVRAVLEAECPKYQELVTYAEETEEERKQKRKIQEQRKLEQIENDRKLRQKIEKEKREKERNNKRQEIENKKEKNKVNNQANLRSGIDLIDNKRREPRMTGNVIIPNNMNIKNERKVYTDEELEELSNQRNRNISVSDSRERKIDKNESISAKKMNGSVNTEISGFEDSEEPISTLNNTSNTMIPGFEDLGESTSTLNNTSNTMVPGFEDLGESTSTLNSESNTMVPGFEDLEESTSTLNNTSNTMVPGFEDLEEQTNTLNNTSNATVPGFENLDKKLDTNNNEKINEKNEQTVQEPKRGRGRPRKYPIEPPKQKGKRGRPRKNPLPEDSEIKHQIIPGVNDFENIPELNKIESNESTTQNINKVNMSDNQTDGSILNESNIQTNELPGLDDINSKTSLGQDNYNTLEDWNRDPFEENTSQTNTLPGLDDWNQDIATGQENNNQSEEDWNRDPFEENASQTNTLPGLDDWNQDIATSQENNNQSEEDWNRDQFEENTSQTNTLPGLDDWEQNISTSQEDNNSSEDDWNKDPFEEINSQTNTYTESNDLVKQINKNIEDNPNEYAIPYSPSKDRKESLRKIEENRLYSTGSLETVLTKDKKIVAFVGTSKCGTSFLVNNLACLFSSIGVKTAILDMTKNKNSYYIYTDNNEDLRNIAYTSIEKLETGTAEGIKVDRNLNVYTALPNDNKDYSNAEAILSTLVQNESLVLIDCDFDTDFSYFANSQEIYLVQSMDILTIQPLTVFLRELKTKGLLDEEKLRIVINKELRVKGLSSKAVIGGMSFYIDPAMSFMTDLFNKDKVKACSIPFDENVYAKYIEQTVNCSISISGYNKNFINSLKILGNMVYPLLSKQTYNSARSVNEARNYGNNFSNEMNNTLNQMKKKY